MNARPPLALPARRGRAAITKASRPLQDREGNDMKGTVLIASLLLALNAACPVGAAAVGPIRTLLSFDPTAGEFPESITTDAVGNLYVSMFVLDQVRRIDPTGHQILVAQMVAGATPAGLKMSPSGTLYVAATGFSLATGHTDPATRGVYRIGRDGSVGRMPGTQAILFPNDLAFDNVGNVYVTDPVGGALWRIDRQGSVGIWIADPLLQGTGELLGFPYGVNGIAFADGRLIVSNTERGTLVAIPVRADGSAGQPEVLTNAPALLGVDGIALDIHGTVYAAVNGQDTLIAVRPDGPIEVLATGADGLNQPSSLAFGTGPRDHRTLFFNNFAVNSPAPTPGVLQMTVGVPGQPLLP
jgi:sugar lactone lactonase YvrE